MRVLLVTPSNSQGLKEYTYNLSLALKEYVELELLVNENFEYDIPGLKTNRVLSRFKYSPSNLLRLIKFLALNKYDIIHLQTPNIVIIFIIIISIV